MILTVLPGRAGPRMKKIICAVFFATTTGHAMAQAGGAAEGARPSTSAPSHGETLTAVVLTGAVAGIIAHSTPATASNH